MEAVGEAFIVILRTVEEVLEHEIDVMPDCGVQVRVEGSVIPAGKVS